MAFGTTLLQLLLLSLQRRCSLKKPLLALLLLLLLLRWVGLLWGLAGGKLRGPSVHTTEPLLAGYGVGGPPPLVARIALHPVIEDDSGLLLQLLQQLVLLLLQLLQQLLLLSLLHLMLQLLLQQLLLQSREVTCTCRHTPLQRLPQLLMKEALLHIRSSRISSSSSRSEAWSERQVCSCSCIGALRRQKRPYCMRLAAARVSLQLVSPNLHSQEQQQLRP